MARSDAIRVSLDSAGIDPQRFAIEWVSSAEAPRFAEVVTGFTQKIRALGPNPRRSGKNAAVWMGARRKRFRVDTHGTDLPGR